MPGAEEKTTQADDRGRCAQTVRENIVTKDSGLVTIMMAQREGRHVEEHDAHGIELILGRVTRVGLMTVVPTISIPMKAKSAILNPPRSR